MAKIVKVSSFKQLIKKADSILESGGTFDEFQKNLIRAERLAKTDKEIIEVSLKLAKAFVVGNNLFFSNDKLFKILCKDDAHEEAKFLLMFNFLSLGMAKTAKYYYEQIKDYLATKQDEKFFLVKHTLDGNQDKKENMNIDAFMQEVFDAAEKDDLDEENASELHQFLGNMISGDNSMFDGLDIIQSEEPRFIVHSKKTKVKDTLNKIYTNLADENLDKVIELYEKQDLNSLKDEDKLAFYYARAVTHLFNKEYEDVLKLCNIALAIDDKKMDFHFLQIESLTALKRYNEIGLYLKAFDDFVPKDNAHFKHFMYILMVSEHWDYAIEYLNKNMNNLKRFYMPEEFLGIFYFNSGKTKDAKKTFINIYEQYGDVSHAKAYLFYIAQNVKDGIPLSAITCDWPKMTMIYVKYLCNYVTMNEIDLYNSLCRDYKTIIDAMKWLAQFPTTTAFLDMFRAIVFAPPYLNKKLQNQLQIIKNELLEVLFTTPFVNDEIKVDMLNIMCIIQEEHTLHVISEGKIFVPKKPRIELFGTFKYAYCLAKSIAMTKGLNYYEKFERVIDTLIQIYNENKLVWRSSEAICALIVEDFLNLKMQDVAPFVKYTKAIKNKYSEQLNLVINPPVEE